jgi:DNA-binding MarR family transcriptional regulator
MQREDCGVMAQSTARLVMSHLAVNGSMGQLEIVALTRLKPPTVSTLLRRMQAEGYITRVPDEKDKRAILVALTEKGKDFDREQLHRLSTNDHQAVRGLTAEEQKTLESLLLRMRDNLKEV